jgi:amino acid transporter
VREIYNTISRCFLVFLFFCFSPVQARLYLGLGRDGLLPSLFAIISPNKHIPVRAQIWCGLVAGVLATLFDVSHLSHILSVGTLVGKLVLVDPLGYFF